MNRKTNIVCPGELIIDFVCTDIDQGLSKGEKFLKKAGGAPANVAAAITRLGGEASFVGKVGNDPFGKFLVGTLKNEGVCTKNILLDSPHPTTLAFVALQENGERDFVFNRGADGQLNIHDLRPDLLDNAGILHAGSATALLGGPFYEAYLSLIKQAKEKEILISFDPNHRDALWNGDDSLFIKRCQEIIPHANLIKVSEEELELITGKANQTDACQTFHKAGVEVVCVTLGKKGTLVSHISGHYEIIPSVKVKSIDSTGAGDAFIGGLLYLIANYYESKMPEFGQTLECVAFANRVGALTCTQFGAIPALPTLKQVDQLAKKL